MGERVDRTFMVLVDGGLAGFRLKFGKFNVKRRFFFQETKDKMKKEMKNEMKKGRIRSHKTLANYSTMTYHCLDQFLWRILI